MTAYSDAPNQTVDAADGVRYVYRELGDGDVPIVMFHHFRGNLDNWGPALVEAPAANRRVVAFDNAGVGGPSGTTPSTVEQMALDAIAFLEAPGIDQADLFGHSLGSFVVQEVALIRPALVRSLPLASSAPQGAAGMHGWAPEVIDAVGSREIQPEKFLGIFFAPSRASRQAGMEFAQRALSRTVDPDQPTTWETRQARYDAITAWGIPNHSLLQRVGAIDVPVFVANGDSDPMILPHYSYLLAGLIPHARVKLYPGAAHGFLYQHHAEFAADVRLVASWPTAIPRPRLATGHWGQRPVGVDRSRPCAVEDSASRPHPHLAGRLGSGHVHHRHTQWNGVRRSGGLTLAGRRRRLRSGSSP